MTAQPKPNDPSMEDILASIRRIIADDQANAGKKPEPAPVAAPAALEEEEEDVFNLTPALRVNPPEPAVEEPAADANQDDVDVLFREIEEPAPAAEAEADTSALMAEFEQEFAAASDPEPAPVPAAPPPAMTMEELISPQAGASVSSAFSQLAHTVLAQNARTLDDLVQDMLRPMLKTWLDNNLPTIVERLVRAEIERVARGGR